MKVKCEICKDQKHEGRYVGYGIFDKHLPPEYWGKWICKDCLDELLFNIKPAKETRQHLKQT